MGFFRMIIQKEAIDIGVSYQPLRGLYYRKFCFQVVTPAEVKQALYDH